MWCYPQPWVQGISRKAGGGAQWVIPGCLRHVLRYQPLGSNIIGARSSVLRQLDCWTWTMWHVAFRLSFMELEAVVLLPEIKLWRMLHIGLLWISERVCFIKQGFQETCKRTTEGWHFPLLASCLSLITLQNNFLTISFSFFLLSSVALRRT